MDESSDPAVFADLTVREFTERLASAEPVPGGGSASAIAGSLGASLVAMVARLSIGRPRYADHEATLLRCLDLGTGLQEDLLRLADADSAAFATFSTALKMPRDTAEQQSARRAAVERAARAASEVPWDCVRACSALAAAAETLAGRSNVNASSDLLVASMLAEAGARGAAENVRVNLPSTGDEEYNERMRRSLDEALHDVGSLVARTREFVLSGRSREAEEA
jgi:methenyltetrahydrofolate cyclohydrolase